MIAKLKGTVDAIDGDSAVIDVNGVGYLVSASARTLRDLVVGGLATLLVETIVREDAIALYGFLETAERDWFRILTTVQGVGARVALSILSTLAPDEIARAIAAQDRAGLSRAPGVGPKLAARLATGRLATRARCLPARSTRTPSRPWSISATSASRRLVPWRALPSVWVVKPSSMR